MLDLLKSIRDHMLKGTGSKMLNLNNGNDALSNVNTYGTSEWEYPGGDGGSDGDGYPPDYPSGEGSESEEFDPRKAKKIKKWIIEEVRWSKESESSGPLIKWSTNPVTGVSHNYETGWTSWHKREVPLGFEETE